jgi:hypothetical protein
MLNLLRVCVLFSKTGNEFYKTNWKNNETGKAGFVTLKTKCIQMHPHFNKSQRFTEGS